MLLGILQQTAFMIVSHDLTDNEETLIHSVMFSVVSQQLYPADKFACAQLLPPV